MKRWKEQGRGWGQAAGAAAATWLAVWLLGGPVRVEGDSMMPQVMAGEVVWVWRGGTLWGALPPRGAVVVVESPVSGGQLIKRLVGHPGDQVSVTGNEWRVNGKAVLREAGKFWAADDCLGKMQAAESTLGVVADARSVRLRTGQVYVMGDNLSEGGSEDSRTFGPVPVGAVRGQAVAVLWPLMRREVRVEGCGAVTTRRQSEDVYRSPRLIPVAVQGGEPAPGVKIRSLKTGK